ncbi:MAG: glycosyltransferase family 4 protein, partial [Hyphomicrobium sp.]
PAVRFLDAAIGSLGFYSVNITNSAATQDAFGDYPRPYRKYLRRIEHGLDAPLARLSRADVLSRYAIPDDGLILLTAGRLCEQKGQDRAIRALAQIGGARLVLAGGGPDEPRLRELARSLSIADRVHFVGILTRDEIGDMLGAVDMLVSPSVWETFGLAAVEAAMAGVPIVAADLPVLREVLSAGGSSPVVFVDAEKPGALAEAIEAQRQKTRESAEIQSFRDAIKDKYSQGRMLSSYDALIFGTGR